MSLQQAYSSQPFSAPDSRADDGRREIVISGGKIAISRAISGVKMNLDLPATAYRGLAVSLDIDERGQQTYRIVLSHRDSDLSVTLAQTPQKDETVTLWRRWSAYFGLPSFVKWPDGDIESLQPDDPFGAPTARKRGWPLGKRRSHMSGRRACPPKGCARVVRRDGREIVRYE